MNKERSAIITGAAGGIGQALVRVFHRAGYFVLAMDQTEPDQQLPVDVFIKTDLAECVKNKQYAENVFDDLRDSLPERTLHALINNAAVQVVAPFEQLNRENWGETLSVNLLAPFFMTQAFFPELEAVHGTVVNVSSIQARQSKPGFAAYATSKAALSALTRNLALELGGRIRVNAIEPAAVATDMLKAGLEDKPEALEQLSRYSPLGRIIEPKEVAQLALYLCSEKASLLNGSVISADGGLAGRLHDPV